MAKPNANMGRRWPVRITLALALSGPALAAAEAPATLDVQSGVLEAERLGELAFEAYSQKQYGDAVALYEKAYATSPSADALYNIARVYDVGLRDRPRAIAAYQRFLADPGASAERIERAAERANELLRAERAEQEARPTRTRLATRPAATTPADAEEVERERRASPLRVSALVIGGVGVASAAVGAAFGVSVWSKAQTANASCVENRCTTQRAVDAARTASTHATLATAGVSLGAALVATGTVLWILGADASPEHAASARLHLTPIAGARELGLAFAGGW